MRAGIPSPDRGTDRGSSERTHASRSRLITANPNWMTATTASTKITSAPADATSRTSVPTTPRSKSSSTSRYSACSAMLPSTVEAASSRSGPQTYPTLPLTADPRMFTRAGTGRLDGSETQHRCGRVDPTIRRIGPVGRGPRLTSCSPRTNTHQFRPPSPVGRPPASAMAIFGAGHCFSLQRQWSNYRGVLLHRIPWSGVIFRRCRNRERGSPIPAANSAESGGFH